MTARAPYCLKCQSYTTLDKGGTECEECGSRDIDHRAVPNLGAPASRRPEKPALPVTPERAATLFQKLRESL